MKASNVGVPPLKVNGLLITNPKDKAQALNDQFNSAFSEGKHYTDEEIATKCQLPETKAPPISDISVNTVGVEKLLRNLDPSKAPGPDGITPRILQLLSHEIAPPLTTIFNRSLETAEVPSAWKSANVSPIYKKGEHYKASNYRPISLTSIPCKILEHIIVSNIMDHWELHNVLVPNQHGFRSQRSCESQLLELMEEISKNIEAGIQTDVIVLDFAKAFDRVNHSLLTKKIESYGISGNLNSWIKNFLKDRQQRVVIDGEASDTIHVRSGVPQGSVLGPCLFLAYINDLPDKVNSNTRLFADDTAVDRKIKSSEDQAKLQEDLDSLAAWETQWDMAFHPDKCQVLQVSTKAKIESSYTLHGQRLDIVQSAKYLGVTIQDNGKFDMHINTAINDGNKMLAFTRRNLRVNSKTAKENAYKMLVRPKIEYAAAVWDPHNTDKITSLEKIQRRAARIVSNDHMRTSSVTEMIEKLKWPSLEQRRKAARLTTFYKITKGEVKVACKELKHAPSRSRRGHNQQYSREANRKDIRHHSFFPRTIRDWNNLPQHIVDAKTADAFRGHILQLPC